MDKLQLPHLILPAELLTLLKLNLATSIAPETILQTISANPALLLLLERTMAEFHGGRSLENALTALGWPGFRDRLASIYVYKAIHGIYPALTYLDLIDEVRDLEVRFGAYGTSGNSRVFLLGLYLKLSNLKLLREAAGKFLELRIPLELDGLLKRTQGRSEKLDWLLLIVTHLHEGLGEAVLSKALATGEPLDAIYPRLSPEDRERMFKNLLSYGASIREPDMFLDDRI
jgi:hypothetical protein